MNPAIQHNTWLPPVSAAAARHAPAWRIEDYTAFGAAVAMFLMYTWLRTREPRLGGWHEAFMCLAALFGGWLLPEPLAWWLARRGWITPEAVGSLPLKGWGTLALACGLSAPALALRIIFWARGRPAGPRPL